MDAEHPSTRRPARPVLIDSLDHWYARQTPDPAEPQNVHATRPKRVWFADGTDIRERHTTPPTALPGSPQEIQQQQRDDIAVLLAQHEYLARLLAEERLRYADLWAAVRAVVGADHDGEPDPVAYLRDEVADLLLDPVTGRPIEWWRR
jgi:hypothetical protein